MNKKNMKNMLLIVCGILVIGEWFLFNQNSIRTTEYSFTSEKVNSLIRMVQISDLHNKEFGKNNRKLINKISNLNPDIILMTGDMIQRTTNDYSQIENLIEKLSSIAPCYYAIGNHEQDNATLYPESELLVNLEKKGATILEIGYDSERCYVDVSINNTTIRIGGKYCYDFVGHEAVENEFYRNLTNTDNFIVLLSHKPQDYFDESGLINCGVDLILTGHTHGGLVRVPFLGGLYAPEQGLLPEYDYGKFSNGTTSLIINAGLGISSPFPRINNRPEVTVIELIPKKE